MKMISLFFVFIFSLNLSAQQLPTEWYSESTVDSKADDLGSLSEYLRSILEVQENVLEKSSPGFNKGLNGWVLGGQKTDLAISKSGLLGFAALKATKAVELSWSKVKSSKNERISEAGSDSDVTLNTMMNESEVLASVRPVYKVLLKNLPDDEHASRSQEFEANVLRYHRAMKNVSSLQTGSYVPSKFRLDLSVSFSSPLFGFTKLSGDTRVRLEWKIIPSQVKNQSQKDQKVVRKILEDVDRVLKDVELKEGYKLDNLSIGLGLSKKNLLSFSKVKGSIMGHLFLKKNKMKTIPLPVSNEDSYVWEQEEDKLFKFFKRAKFRKGLKKSVKLSQWFSRQFQSRRSNWEVSKFKTEFTLSYSGFLGLTGTSSSSSVSFTFKK